MMPGAQAMEELFRLDGLVALVTGAAGQLGRQAARTLGRAGAHVVLVDIKGSGAVCEALKSEGLHATPLDVDITDPKAVERGFAAIVEQHGHLDIVANYAAIAVFTPFEERGLDEFMQVLKVNVAGTFLCIQAAAKVMKKQTNGGHIVNIGSIYGLVSGDPRIYTDCARQTSEVYAASKAAIIQMTRYFAVHLAPYRIRVNVISPGGVFNQQGPDFVKNYSQRTPMGRMAREHELDTALLFLVSNASSYVTGHNLVVDGGWTAW